MLQQTQVKTVIPYWERWMRELPTIEALAKASPDKIHKLWEGLGYYTRVRNLQKAAQQIVAQHDGKFPESFDDILVLSGIGRYTAGAICSIAFNQPTPILDGNVIRVLTRLFGIVTDPRKKQTNARLWQLAAELVTCAPSLKSPCSRRRKEALTNRLSDQRRLTSAAPVKGSCSALNQSLMELGALICTPRSPQCGTCPLNIYCRARKQNLQDQLPHLGQREIITARRFIAFIIERYGKFLVRQRPNGGVNAHLWEFPNIEVVPHSDSSSSFSSSKKPDTKSRTKTKTRTNQRKGFSTAEFRPTTAQPLCTIKHTITRYRITLEAWRAELVNPRAKAAGQWLALEQLHQLAFPSAHKKILNHLGTSSPAPARRSGPY